MAAPLYPSDLEIAQANQSAPISEIADALGLTESDYAPYGRHIAKLDRGLPDRLAEREDGKLILVTAITPTPAGEGKSTTTVGLGDALRAAGKKTLIALREPSLGPCFGAKGGATGGGYAQVQPMEDINLHFTGDIHAVSAAHNLLAALLANHLHQGNRLGIDVRRIQWKHVMDLNARHLRQVVCALGEGNGVPFESGFDISTASEVMAILCLAKDLSNLKERLGNIFLAQRSDKSYVHARDIEAQGAMAVLLRDAMRPNLVQTLERTPALIHGGPFANIAHGCNTLLATKLALKLADYVVTEAGFGSDLGAEKFFDIKCRIGDLKPAAVALVATIRALRYHGGAKLKEVNAPNPEALRKGLPNLARHLENVRQFGVPVTVALNRFVTDSKEEEEIVTAFCAERGVPMALSEVWEHGSKGGADLAQLILKAADSGEAAFAPLYRDEMPLEEKIATIATKVYGASDVVFEAAAKRKLRSFAKNGFGSLPVCMAKTAASLSGDASLLGAPEGFTLKIRDARLSAGAGFVVALAGDIMTMPGLGKVPAANGMDLAPHGEIGGLF